MAEAKPKTGFEEDNKLDGNAGEPATVASTRARQARQKPDAPDVAATAKTEAPTGAPVAASAPCGGTSWRRPSGQENHQTKVQEYLGGVANILATFNNTLVSITTCMACWAGPAQAKLVSRVTKHCFRRPASGTGRGATAVPRDAGG